MKSFKEFLNERVSQTKPTEKRKVTKEKLRDMILSGEDVSEVDYSDIDDFDIIFANSKITYELLKKADLDTSNVKYMSHAFADSTLDRTPDWDCANVVSMQHMFLDCTKLTHIGKMDTEHVSNMRGIFRGCTNIRTIERPSDWYKYEWTQHKSTTLSKKYPELYNKELR